MEPGIYEQIVDLLIARQLEELQSRAELGPLEPADSHTFLAQHLQERLNQALSAIQAEPGVIGDKARGQSKLRRQIKVCNEILALLRAHQPAITAENDLSPKALRLLTVSDTEGAWPPVNLRPETPLALGALLTGTRLDPSLISQLKREIATSNTIDILCSFIKWTGIRILKEALQTFTERPGTRLRIITTSYMGATDLKAINYLEGLPQTEVKVSYDTHRTRLHAKAYLFHRLSEFGAAYVGSSNLSQAALTEGLEWNVKISQHEQPYQFEKLRATFETYWNDPAFERYTAQLENRLGTALNEERRAAGSTLPQALFALRPYDFQREILDRIAAEQVQLDRHKHLIVAATGTGKTMIAAFAFKEWNERRRTNKEEPTWPRLLFIAHRREILEQSLATFRGVLGDNNFGDLLVGPFEPTQTNQLFLSIQSWHSRDFGDRISPDHYDFVIVDEFHHAKAPTYQSLLADLQPQCLLGLTATPIRADGLNITDYFDGHLTAEIPLPAAINRKLLCPFQYFGISDETDFSTLTWQRGGYTRKGLNNLLTGNHARANLVIEKTGTTVLDISACRGIGFCASKEHARFMADCFNHAGIAATFLTADSPGQERTSARIQLQRRSINFIFVVDLYNEGVDIPEIDTILFLRPTESLTIFLQQLGRGLRLTEEKDCLTVLDFVGQAHRNFRFDLRLKALSSQPDRSVREQLEHDFPFLPAGCTIQLERVAKQYILKNIQQALHGNRRHIVNRLRAFTRETGQEVSLVNFTRYHQLSLDDIYRRGSWNQLCAEAGLRPSPKDPEFESLRKRLRRMLHINDLNYIRQIEEWLSAEPPAAGKADRLRQRQLTMLLLTLWPRKDAPSRFTEGLQRLRRNPTICQEIRDILAIRAESVTGLPVKPVLPFLCPLQLHAEYTTGEILAAFGYRTLSRQREMREGVLHLPDLPADLLFITTHKNETNYSPSTMYEDYAISSELFHWQSQSTTSAGSRTGQRYIHQRETKHTILLFVREHKKQHGLAVPYHFFGPADLVSHHGSRPMNITWKLRHPIPPHLLRKSNRLAVE